MEDLKELHDEANAPKSDNETARDLNVLELKESDLPDIKKSVLIEALKVRGITHETLNYSISKFSKLNKPQLLKLLKEDNNKAGESIPNSSEKAQTQPVQEFDIFGAVLELKEQILNARASGDYSKLDSSIADKLLISASNDDSLSNLPVNSSYITKVIIGLGVIYFTARLIGFDTIADKINQVRKKATKKAENDTDKQDS